MALLWRHDLVPIIPDIYMQQQMEALYWVEIGVIGYGEYLQGARVDGAKCAELGGAFAGVSS